MLIYHICGKFYYYWYSKFCNKFCRAQKLCKYTW